MVNAYLRHASAPGDCALAYFISPFVKRPPIVRFVHGPLLTGGVQLRLCRLRGPRIRRDRAASRLQLAWLEPIWDSFWILLNFSLFSARDHRVGTTRVVFLARTPGNPWPDRAYPEDLGRVFPREVQEGWRTGKVPQKPLAGRGVTALGNPAVFPI